MCLSDDLEKNLYTKNSNKIIKYQVTEKKYQIKKDIQAIYY